MNNKNDCEFWQERSATNLENVILKKLAVISANMRNPAPFKPLKLPAIEEQDPIELGRGGYCNVAIEVLLELYPKGTPFKLTSNGKDCPHVFLMFKEQPLDIYGVTSLSEMRTYYKIPSLKVEPISIQEIQKIFRSSQTLEETIRLKAHFKKYILAEVGKKFPPTETQNTNG